jgi:hypothetical protein
LSSSKLAFANQGKISSNLSLHVKSFAQWESMGEGVITFDQKIIHERACK